MFVLAVVAGISNSVMIRVLLVRVFYERTAVTLVSYSVTVTILLIRISSKRTVVLKRNEKERVFQPGATYNVQEIVL